MVQTQLNLCSNSHAKTAKENEAYFVAQLQNPKAFQHEFLYNWRTWSCISSVFLGAILGINLGMFGLKEAIGLLAGITLALLARKKSTVINIFFGLAVILAIFALFLPPFRGTHRWIRFFGLSVNLSLVLLALGSLVRDHSEEKTYGKYVGTIVISILCLNQSFTICGMFLLGLVRNARWSRRSVLIIGFSILCFATIILFNENRRLRLTEFLSNSSYHLKQVRQSVSSARLFGKASRVVPLPAARTDLALLGIVRKYGAWTATIYLLLIVGAFKSTDSKQESMARRVTLIAVIGQVIMTSGLVPVVGMPAPFLGKGGTEWFCFASLLTSYLYEKPGGQS